MIAGRVFAALANVPANLRYAEGQGDCLFAAVRRLLADGDPEALLVGAYVVVEGRRFRHVWVECGSFAYETSRGQNICTDLRTYRAELQASRLRTLKARVVLEILEATTRNHPPGTRDAQAIEAVGRRLWPVWRR